MSLLDSAIVALIPVVPRFLVRRFARPYIAGETLDDAVARLEELASEGCCATMDVLGEEVKSGEETEAFRKQYLDVLDRIESLRLDSNISVKPSALGLGIDPMLCETNLRQLLTHASRLNNFVRIDMEDSGTTDTALDMYIRLRSNFDNVGIALQSYLFRSMEDIRSLVPMGVNVRVCKGIYIEPADIAFKDRQDIRDNFMLMVEALLTAECYVGIATHDRQLVERSIELIERLDLAKDKYEFQMLLGVEASLRRQIVAGGHRMRVYVPFGEHWYAYSTRRLKENPEVAGHIFRNIFAPR